MLSPYIFFPELTSACLRQKVLGTPTREEIKCMNPNYTEFKFPQIKAHPWHKVTDISSDYSLLMF